MVLYAYNKQFVGTCVIDTYESLVWSERYCDVSEFELKVHPSFLAFNDVRKGYYISSDASERIMIVESIEVDTDEDGNDYMLISGRSLESILDRRVIYRLTRFGVSDDPSVEILPTPPTGFSHVKYVALPDNTNIYYDTGIAMNASFAYSGKWARTGAQTKGNGYAMMGTYNGTSGFMLFVGSSLKYIDIGLGSPIKEVKHEAKLPYTSTEDTANITVNIADGRYLYSLNGTAKEGSYSGSIIASNIRFFNTGTTYADVGYGYRVAMVGPHEIQSGSNHYRYYPVVEDSSGAGNIARFKLVNGAWVYDTDYGMNHLTGTGTLAVGPKEKSQSVQLYKAATALVDENFVHNLESDPYWGDQSKRNIPNLTCKNTDDYTDPMVTNWSITGSYYGETVLDALKDMLTERHLGFKIGVIDGDIRRWRFEIYAGKDRSYDQTVTGMANDIVIFSPEMANIGNLQYLESDAAYKNVCFVMGEHEILNTNTTGKYKLEASVTATFYTTKIYVNDGETTTYDVIKARTKPDDDFKETVSTPFFNFTVHSSNSITVITVVTARELMRGTTKVEANTTIGTYTTPFTMSNWSDSYTYTSAQTQLSTRRCAFAMKDEELSGLDRKEMTLENEIPSTYQGESGETTYSSEIYASLLRNAGFDELTKYRVEKSFSGELLSYGDAQYKFKIDFDIGDVVEIADQYGNNGRTRITEMVYTNDENGETWVPTVQTDKEDEEKEE